MENKIDNYNRSAATVDPENRDFSLKSVEDSSSNSSDDEKDNIEFIGQGSFSCVFRPAIKCDNTIDPNNPNDTFFVSKISKKDKYIDNEIHISSIIQKINHYYHYFSPILENCDADLYKLGSATASSIAFQKCDLFKKHGVIGEYGDSSQKTQGAEIEEPYQGGSEVDEGEGDEDDQGELNNNVEYIYNKIRYIGHNDLYSYLENSKSNENAWKDAFTYLSYSISLLRENGIVHYDFKGNNVMVHDKHHTPIIIDFGLSIDINKTIRVPSADIEQSLKRAFYVYSTDYEVWCPEIDFICYFTQERKSALFDPITIEDIDFVCADFMKNNEIFGEQYFNMNEQDRDTYHETMRAFFSEFLNKPATEAIIEITEKYYKTWDMYSLTVCFQGAVLLPIEYRKFISADPRQRL